jgi:aryl-alcohol dehydrogenase-like predicted oxidoreductase
MHDNGQLDRRDFLKTATAGAVGLSLTGMTARNLLAQEEKGGAVKKRKLGKTGLMVSVVAFGCGRIVPQHLPILQSAYDNGINLFDTAYGSTGGQSETAIGKLVEAIKDRESFHIVSKASGFSPPNGNAKEVYDAFKKHVTRSLGRMKTEYVDVYYWPHGASSPEQTRKEHCREALLKLKEEGLIRHIGTSSHANYAKVCEAAIKDGYYEVLMPVLNIASQNSDDAGPAAQGRRRRGRSIEDTTTLLKEANKKQIGIVAMKAAQNGFLGQHTDKLLEEAFPKDSKLSRHQKLYTYMLKQEGVCSVVVGIGAAKHLMEALEVARA